jgi:hypothetical protein
MTLNVPASYLRLLDGEAARVGSSRRDFLLLLAKRRSGEIVFERPRATPKPKLPPRELEPMRLYRWPLTASELQTIDKDRRALGNPSPGWYFMLLFSDWLGISPLALWQPSRVAEPSNAA